MRAFDLVAEAGSTITEWINDDMPYPVNAANGMLTAMPLAWDLSDLHLPFPQHMDTAGFAEQSLPHRIRALGAMLDWILKQAGVWPVTEAKIVDAWYGSGN
jgi:hypothetical protein